MPNSPHVAIVCAFAAEARPLRKRLRLKRADHAALPCPLYVSDTHVLIETGLGKLGAAAAVAALLASHPTVRGLINVGIAGGTLPIGSACLAHGVIDRASRRRWYPDLPPRRVLSSIEHHLTVETVDTPDTRYQADRLFDMEAAGVFAAAVPILGVAGTHCLKIVSDGPDSALDTLNKHRVTELVEQHTDTVMSLCDFVASRREPAREHKAQIQDAASRLVERTTRHSESERHRLHHLLSRHLTLVGTLPEREELGAINTAAELAASLEARINEQEVHYH